MGRANRGRERESPWDSRQRRYVKSALSSAARLDNAHEGQRDRKGRQKGWEVGWNETVQWGWRWNYKECTVTKDGIVGKTSCGRQAKERISTTNDSFHTCTRTASLDRTEREEHYVSDAFGLRNRALHRRDRRFDRFKGLIDDGRRDNLITCTG